MLERHARAILAGLFAVGVVLILQGAGVNVNWELAVGVGMVIGIGTSRAWQR